MCQQPPARPLAEAEEVALEVEKTYKTALERIRKLRDQVEVAPKHGKREVKFSVQLTRKESAQLAYFSSVAAELPGFVVPTCKCVDKDTVGKCTNAGCKVKMTATIQWVANNGLLGPLDKLLQGSCFQALFWRFQNFAQMF
eukprot:CAMPEP_0118926232 /NCGR_PEP_ID=MMETSP1169-20130426/3975_1 /TAXON_ID=36882 /ORGANISM="Pyramimonas obovata, Strain CCMP722" /LENGTH=140 /DNA_ID=CAMNT_0006867741 /DNA_START=391 /DNA_END=810 /DNA_ORIENTATION=+